MRRLRWFGHLLRIEDGQLSRDVLYGERTSSSRSVVRPMLSCKDDYNRDIKSSEIDPDSWESFECRMISALSFALCGQVQRDRRPGGNSCEQQREQQRGGTTKRGSCCPALTRYSLHMWQLTGTDCHSRIGTFSNTIPYFKVRNLVFRRIPLSFETEGKNNQRRGDGCSNYPWSGWSCMYTVMLKEDLVEWEDVTESHFAEKWLLTWS